MSGSSQTLPSNSDCQKGVAVEAASPFQPRPMSPDTGAVNKLSEIWLHTAEE